MMSRARLVVGIALCVGLGGPVVAFGQGGTDGSIVGYVFDQGGLPLKGIKVSATSPTQIGGTKQAYSNDEGFFRLPQLLPGEFELRAAAPNMRTVLMKAIKVGIGGAAEVNIIMDIETKTEEVSVIEKAPLISTTKANVKETFDLEMVEGLPHGSRDNVHNQVVNDIAGGMNGRIRGGSTSQTIFSQDGFEMKGQFPTLKSSAAYEINSGGYGVDNPMAAGGAINLVTKSGSNRFEFEFNATADSNRLRFFEDAANSSSAASYFYVVNPMISGPIIKDKLWFMFNTESHIIQQGRAPDVTGYFPEPETYRKFIQKGTLKLTWQVNARNKVQSLSNFDSPHEINMRDGLGIAPEAQRNRHAFRFFTGLVWESLLTDNLVLRSQVGVIAVPQHIFPKSCLDNPVNCDHIPSVVQKFPQKEERGNDNQHERDDLWSLQFQNRLEWYVAQMGGDHQVTLREHFYSEQDIREVSKPGDSIIEWNGLNRDFKNTYYSSDPRYEDARFGWNITSTTTFRHITTLSDAWRPSRFFTITPGLSHVWASGSNNNGQEVVGTWTMAPAISAAWDATHDGRTVVRGSYNQYVDIAIDSLARHTVRNLTQRRCAWDDATQDFTKTCEWSGGRSTNTVGLPCGPTGLDERGKSCRENLKIPRTYEYTLGGEREVAPGVSVALDVIYRTFNNLYETRETNRIFSPTGESILGSTGRNGRSETTTDLETPDAVKRVYRGLTLAVNKREGVLKMKASYTLSDLKGNSADGISNPWGDYAPRDVYLYGALPDDHRHEVKLSATYSFTTWLSSGLRYRFFSGTPYNRLFRNSVTGGADSYRATTGMNAGANLNDPSDDRELRLPDQQDVNVQVRANLFPLTGQKIDFYVDVLNVLSLHTVKDIGQEDGKDFGVPRSWMDPFRVRLGFNYKY